MSTVESVRREAARLMDGLGRRHLGRSLNEIGWRIEFDGAKRRLGLCRWKRNGRVVRILSFSRHYAQQHRWPVMEDVVRHEIAHAIDYERRGRSAHDRVWREIARSVGADPTRIHEGAELLDPTSKYVGICPECRSEHPFYRRVTRAHACPDCCREYNRGRFTHRFKLHIVERETGRIVQASGKKIEPAARRLF